jgi:hypothetical protein
VPSTQSIPATWSKSTVKVECRLWLSDGGWYCTQNHDASTLCGLVSAPYSACFFRQGMPDRDECLTFPRRQDRSEDRMKHSASSRVVVSAGGDGEIESDIHDIKSHDLSCSVTRTRTLSSSYYVAIRHKLAVLIILTPHHTALCYTRRPHARRHRQSIFCFQHSWVPLYLIHLAP